MGNWLCHEKPQEHVRKILQQHRIEGFAAAETVRLDIKHRVLILNLKVQVEIWTDLFVYKKMGKST